MRGGARGGVSETASQIRVGAETNEENMAAEHTTRAGQGGAPRDGDAPAAGAANSNRGNPLLRLVAPLAYAYRWHLLLVLLMLPLSALMATLLPYLTKVAIDEYIVPAAQTGNLAAVYTPLLELVALAAGVVALGYLADAVYISILQRTGQGLIAEMRGERKHHQHQQQMPAIGMGQGWGE